MKTLLVIFPFLFMLLGFTGCNKMDPPPYTGPSIPQPRIYLYIQDKEGNDLLQVYDMGLIKDYYRVSVTFDEDATFIIPLLEIGEFDGKHYLILDSTDAYGDFLPFLEKDNGTVDFSIEIPTFDPAPTIQIHLKWNAEYVSEKDREISSYEDVTINGQPYEIEPDGQIVYVVE